MRTLLILGYILGTTLAIPITKDDRSENGGVKGNKMEEFRHFQDPNDTHLIRNGSNRNPQFHREEMSQAHSERFYIEFFVTKGKQAVTYPRANIHIYSNTTSHNENKFGGKPLSHKPQKNTTNKRKGGKTFESGWFKNISCEKMDDGHLGKNCRKILLNKRSIGYQTTEGNTYTSSDETNDAFSQSTRNVNNAFDSSEFYDSNDLEDISYDYYTTDTHSNALSSEFSDQSDSNEANLSSDSKQDGDHGALNRSGISSSVSVSSESRESRESGSNIGSKEVKLGKNSNELSAAKDSSERDLLGSISTTSTTNWNVSASDSDSSDDITDMRRSSMSSRVSYSRESSSLNQSNESDASTDFIDYQNLAEMEGTIPSVN